MITCSKLTAMFGPWLVAALLIAPADSNAQAGGGPPMPKTLSPNEKRELGIEKIGEGGWRPVKTSPSKIFADCDRFMASLHDISGINKYVFEKGADYGYALGEMEIASPQRFHVTTAELVEYPERKVTQVQMTADGKRLKYFDTVAAGSLRPVGQSRLPKNVFAAWFEDYPKLIFAGLGTKDRPLTALYRSASLAGLRFVVEERRNTFNGHTFVTDRVVGIRKGNRTRPAYRTEILIDAKTHAPITLRVTRGSGFTEERSFWSCKWDLSVQAFPQKTFTIK